MAKFADLQEKDRIDILKGEFIQLLEEACDNPADIKKQLTEEQAKVFEEFLPKIKKSKEECSCGTCINLEMIDGRIPEQLKPLVTIARKRLEDPKREI